MKGTHHNGMIVWTQGLVWLCVLLIPGLAAYLFTGSVETWVIVTKGTFFGTFPIILFYLLDFFWLVPRYLFAGRKVLFYLLNALFIALFIAAIFLKAGPIPDEVYTRVPMKGIIGFYAVTISVFACIQGLGVVLAVGARSIMRWNETKLRLKEAESGKREAELNWLRYQLNPHFLFNTMNNISSLTQIDPDLAQESIGLLSDVLRYTLYETDKPAVPLKGEIEFMKDYISLMKLRCNDMTTVTVSLEAPEGDAQVAPLLYISLIENAFKHGVNARAESFVEVSLRPDGHDLRFTCRNSLFEKAGEDHIGSGIGVANLKKRLELIYPGRYEYRQQSGEGFYEATLTLKGMI